MNTIKQKIDVEATISKLNIDHGKLSKYTKEQIREILNSVNEIGVNKTSKKYDVSKSTIRMWRNPGRNAKYLRNQYNNNIEDKRNQKRELYKSNPKYIIDVNKRYVRKRYKTDPDFRMRMLLSTRTWKVLKEQNQKKSKFTKEYLGCTLAELRTHFEKLFTTGMTWDNLGKWHIDHIIPCSKFDLTDPKQQKKCFHYSNLQPLWAKDNITKGNKIQ